MSSSEDQQQAGDNNNNALGYPKLVCRTPVPSDIEVSQQIVKEVGLLSITEVGRQWVQVQVQVQVQYQTKQNKTKHLAFFHSLAQPILVHFISVSSHYALYPAFIDLIWFDLIQQ